MRWTRRFAAIAGFAVVRAAGAQQAALPVHVVVGPVHATTEPLGLRVTARLLDDGRLLVNDSTKGRLLLFDSTLEHATVVADTSAATSKAWGSGLANLIAFSRDSSLVRDVQTGAYLVIDPLGKVARIIPVAPAARRRLAATDGDAVGYDGAGHLLFRPARPFFALLLDQDFVGDTLMKGPDTVPILRYDLASGALDTLALVRAPRTRQAIRRRAQGGGSGRPAINPIPAGDDWTVTADGTVGVVRVADYHVDWYHPDRRSTSAASIPAARVPISPAEKRAMIDSLRALDSSRVAARAPMMPNPPPVAVIEASDLPDVWPPFVSGSAVPAAEGGLWIREQAPRLGFSAPIYDAISHEGKLIDHVQLPAGAAPVAVGRGTVYVARRMNGVTQLLEMSVR